MGRYKLGKPWFDFKNRLPRLRLHEKRQNTIKWILRGLTVFGVFLSLVTLDKPVALGVSVALVALDWVLERILFFYTSMYVQDMILDYDPDAWKAMLFVSIGKPEDPRSKKIVGIWLNTQEYAEKFFGVLHNWTHTDDFSQGNLKLTFVIDEDMYFVFIYSDPLSESFKEFNEKVANDNKYEKYGKEHMPLIMQQILCRGFPTTKEFALHMFLDNNPPGKGFLLAPYISGEKGQPIPADNIQPILMSDYKSKIPGELDDDDIESVHWKKIVAKDRRAVGSDA